MSMLFRSKEPVSDTQNQVKYPGCRALSTSSAETETQCTRCGISFRRITVVDETNADGVPLTEQAMEEKNRGWKLRHLSSSPQNPSLKDQFPLQNEWEDEEKDDDDIREFKRVKIVSISRPISDRYMADPSGQTGSLAQMRPPVFDRLESTANASIDQDTMSRDSQDKVPHVHRIIHRDSRGRYIGSSSTYRYSQSPVCLTAINTLVCSICR